MNLFSFFEIFMRLSDVQNSYILLISVTKFIDEITVIQGIILAANILVLATLCLIHKNNSISVRNRVVNGKDDISKFDVKSKQVKT